ncbi:MAG: sodium/solute symporter [Phycisphaerales bacterium]|nr:sodium/solute symporter [Phycisphaerales bacterium]
MVFWDWIVIGLYFSTLLGMAWWVISQRQDSSADYFLAGRNVGWFAVGCSLFASNIGSEHLVGLAGTGANDGVAMAHYELHAWCLLILGWVLVPFYARSLVFTMPEFLERRYTPAARWFLSLVSLISYVFTKIAVSLFAAGIVFQTLFPEPLLGNLSNFWLGAIGVVVVTGIYTVLGGLRAVVYTDMIQAGVLIVGSIMLTAYGLNALGGWGELYNICGSDMFNLWKPLTTQEFTLANVLWTEQKFPWLGMLFCAPVVGLWYWCTDQYIVQRTLAAPNQTQARRGTIFGAYLKLLPVFLFIVPGMIAYALAKSGGVYAGLLEPGASNQAYPMLVRNLLPAGLRGLVVGALLAALMSSLASVFNSCSTLFTIDIYKKMYPKATEHTLVWVGRIATSIMVMFGLIWIPLITMMSDTLYEYLQSVQAYIAPPIAAVFFFGVFSRRVNAKGCMTGLIAGFVIGMFRLGCEICTKSTQPGGLLENNAFLSRLFADGTFLNGLATINFLYFSMMLFTICVIFITGVSLLTGAPAPAKIQGLTFATLSAEDRRITRASWNKWDVIHTSTVILLILIAYLYFRG